MKIVFSRSSENSLRASKNNSLIEGRDDVTKVRLDNGRVIDGSIVRGCYWDQRSFLLIEEDGKDMAILRIQTKVACKTQNISSQPKIFCSTRFVRFSLIIVLIRYFDNLCVWMFRLLCEHSRILVRAVAIN